MSLDDLKNVLLQLNGPSTEVVMQAYYKLDEFINHPESIGQLFEIYHKDENFQVLNVRIFYSVQYTNISLKTRFSAGVVLNNAVLKTWSKVDQNIRESIKNYIVDILLNENKYVL